MAKLDASKKVTITINNAEELRVAIERLATASRVIAAEWKEKMDRLSKSPFFIRFLADDKPDSK